MDRSKATYLGDGLYVEDHGWQVELFAHNGIAKTNSVFLEPSTLEAFLVWLKEHGR
jgi:hypothetical protein